MLNLPWDEKRTKLVLCSTIKKLLLLGTISPIEIFDSNKWIYLPEFYSQFFLWFIFSSFSVSLSIVFVVFCKWFQYVNRMKQHNHIVVSSKRSLQTETLKDFYHSILTLWTQYEDAFAAYILSFCRHSFMKVVLVSNLP